MLQQSHMLHLNTILQFWYSSPDVKHLNISLVPELRMRRRERNTLFDRIISKTADYPTATTLFILGSTGTATLRFSGSSLPPAQVGSHDDGGITAKEKHWRRQK